MPTYYFVNPTNANLSWSLASSWATSSGGTAGTLSFPTASDDVLFDTNSGTGTCSVFIAASCRSLDFSGYSGTINFSDVVNNLLFLTSSASTLAPQAKLVLSPTMTITGGASTIPSSRGLWINGSYQITSSGKIWERTLLNFASQSTQSLADNLITSGTMTFTAATIFTSSNANVTVSIAGNLDSDASRNVVFSNIPLIFTGSANQNIGIAGAIITTPSLTIDKSPTSQLVYTSNIVFTTNNFELKGGIMNSGIHTITLNGLSDGVHTIKTNGNILGFSGSEVRLGMGCGDNRSLTLLDDLKLFSGSRLRLNTQISGKAQTINGPGDFYFGDGTNTITTALTFNTGIGSPQVALSGSAVMRLQGLGSITWTLGSPPSTATSYFIANPMVINMVGTLAFVNTDNSFPYGGNLATSSLTYTAGTIGTPTLRPANCTLQTSGVTWTTVQLPIANNTIRLNNNLQATSITVSANTTFTGSAGFTASNFTQTTAGTTTTFQNGNSYLVTNTLTGLGTLASPVVFRASTLNTPRAIFTHQNGGAQSMIYVSGNFIDSSQGQTIWTVGTILNNTINWNIAGRPSGSSAVFVY